MTIHDSIYFLAEELFDLYKNAKKRGEEVLSSAASSSKELQSRISELEAQVRIQAHIQQTSDKTASEELSRLKIQLDSITRGDLSSFVRLYKFIASSILNLSPMHTFLSLDFTLPRL